MNQVVDIAKFFRLAPGCPLHENGDCIAQIIDSNQRGTGYGGTVTDFTYESCEPQSCGMAYWLNRGEIPK